MTIDIQLRVSGLEPGAETGEIESSRVILRMSRSQMFQLVMEILGVLKQAPASSGPLHQIDGVFTFYGTAKEVVE